MIAGLFISRVMLSGGIILFVIVSFIRRDIKKQVSNFFSSPLLWAMSLLFLLPLLSGIWSEDKDLWALFVRIKLPLLVLPLAFAAPLGLSGRQWELLLLSFTIIVTIATAWSMFYYVINIEAVNESYLKAKTMITPLSNDHVRFSWLVSIAALSSAWIYWNERRKKRLLAWVMVALTVWFVIFLHLLAARTGLFSFYIMLLVLAGWLVINRIKWVYSIALIGLLIALPLTAWFLLPSFQNRVRFMQYDFGYFSEAHYLPGATDAVRVISLKAGWHIMQENSVAGTGFGDIATETKKYYATAYPGMVETDKILPGSEWLIYGSGLGWAGFILFTVIMLVPFLIRTRHPLIWWLLNITAAFSFIFDIGLEVQFGVFIYSFIVLWWYTWLKS